ncbi:MAG: M48 family metallopeptidase [Sphingopyxis sp.]|jgi:hypothetical protein|nr:M48 family metallopeptidase [Sphingopyxis sp.]
MSLTDLFRRKPGRARAEPLSNPFTVHVDAAEIAVIATRHPRARRLRLRYDAARGALRLTLPLRANMADAQAWVAQQHQWIAAQLGSGIMRIPVGDGTVLPWGDGTGLTIQWRADAPRAPTLADDRLVLGGPPDRIGPRVGRWLSARAKQEFGDRTRALAARCARDHGARPLARVLVGDARMRWGSCAVSGDIRYNWRLIMAPHFVRNAITGHEVAHLAHMNHSAEFYAVVNALVGADHDQSRAWLRAHGRELHSFDFTGAV